MAEDKKDAPNGKAGKATETAAQPEFRLLGQYIGDLSFENPGGAKSILSGAASPSFAVNISVQVKKQEDSVYAVELSLVSKATRDEAVLFNIELVYGGVFRAAGFADNQLPPILMIECPRLIFPFARQVLASVTQAGGFPPLLMEPVNFEALYRQNLAKMTQDSGANKPATN